jgi:lipopolysaccharide/colanic/teichoic acid biosynthesis glycosyltransferase
VTVQSSEIKASGSQALSVSYQARGLYALGLKRAVDVVFVLALLPLVIPFLALVAIAISMDGHQPFFRQERVGLNGNRFWMWKFRTMVPDAEKELKHHLASNPDAQAEWNSRQKLEEDPRITRIGRVLRRTSMDELPQLINVLTGQMSLVGPRPMMPSQQALYPGHAYYRMRPGMTGAWQVSARNQSTFADRAKFDDQYEARLSFFTDLALIGRTVGVVFRGTGI